MVDALNAREVHGACVMANTRKQIYTLAIRLAIEVSSLDGILRTVRLVPARFAFLRFMNDTRYLSREVVSSHERPKVARSKMFRL